MIRSRDSAERLLEAATSMRWLLSQEDMERYELMGNMLANVCRITATGLGVQINIAKELMRG